MLRAMEASERAGVPAVGIFGKSFAPLAEIMAKQSGIPLSRLAVYPGVMATEPEKSLIEVSRTVLTEQVLRGLTETLPEKDASSEVAEAAAPTLKAVFTGTLDEVQDHFCDKGWSDGLPVIPPTIDRVEAFLAQTPCDRHDVLGVLAPERREATVESVAINGVMAGCRPEYMPILVAIVECLADPTFRIEDAGSTPGWEPLVILSGPLAKTLDFNAGTGAMRIGRRANSSVGRFTRLYMRNVCGLRIPPGVTDQAGLGYTFNVAMTEDDEAVTGLGWPSFRSDRGFADDETVVTVQGVVNIGSPIYTHGDEPADHLEVICDYVTRAIAPNVSIPTLKRGAGHHLIAMSPSIAEVFARHGITKAEIKQYVYEHVVAPAGYLERLGKQGTVFDLHDFVAEGRLPADYAESDDPDRLVRVIMSPDSLGIVVTGNPGRNQSRAYIGNHVQGVPISRVVQLTR